MISLVNEIKKNNNNNKNNNNEAWLTLLLNLSCYSLLATLRFLSQSETEHSFSAKVLKL